MPFKRCISDSESSTISRSPSFTPPQQTKNTSPSTKVLPNVTVYILHAKLDTKNVEELSSLAELHSRKLCTNIEDADVIITTVRMRKRLERHIPWSVAVSKAVLTPQWLRDSVAHGAPLPCGPYAALLDLHDTTVANCPDCTQNICACPDSPGSAASISPATSLLSDPLVSDASFPVLPSLTSTSSPKTRVRCDNPLALGTSGKTVHNAQIPAHLLPPVEPPKMPVLQYTARLACARASPLICVNQALVSELDIIRSARTLEGEARSALSYSRAIAVVKAYPMKITSKRQVEKLPYLGVKILGMVEDFLNRGHIREAQTLRNSERIQVLELFSSIYGIGPTTARKLYALGLREIRHLEVYYGIEPSDARSCVARGDMDPEEKAKKVKKEDMILLERSCSEGRLGRDREEGAAGESWIKVALNVRDDLQSKIPRVEVEEMHRVVMCELEIIEPGCVSTIVGGYRRGKTESNDVDIVFTHPNGKRPMEGLCKRLVCRLNERGMVTHIMHLGGFHAHDTPHTKHRDSLEKALTVFVLPSDSRMYRGKHRRLDLIFAPPEVYWTAVVGWTGSTMFQRDLRLQAKERGLKFDSSGITRRQNGMQIFAKREKEVFDILGLEWVDPTLRNADA